MLVSEYLYWCFYIIQYEFSKDNMNIKIIIIMCSNWCIEWQILRNVLELLKEPFLEGNINIHLSLITH